MWLIVTWKKFRILMILVCVIIFISKYDMSALQYDKNDIHLVRNR